MDDRGPNLSAYDLRSDSWLRSNIPSRERKIRELPWVQDGIGIPEMGAVQGLIYLGRYGGSFFFDMMEQPWVPQGKNRPAMESLGRLAKNDAEALRKLVNHSTIRDGITDDEAKNVATLWRVQIDAPSLVDQLLDPQQVILEERPIDLSLAGQVLITIIRTSPGPPVTMDLMEAAVRTVEGFMSVPFPRRQVNWLILERAGGAGSNSGTHITTQPKVDKVGYTKNDYETGYPGESAHRHFIHEASHYYWRGGERWVNEGAATFIEAIAVNVVTGEPFSLERPPCPYARNIAELENLDPEGEDPASTCHYRLGERVFHDLYRNMDDTTFRLAFRRLYLMSQFDNPKDECAGTYLNVCHLQAAFTTDVPEETAALAQKVINRWYDGSEPFDLSLIEDTSVDPDLPQIGGRIEDAYLSHNRISASQDIDRLLFTFRFSHRNSGPFRVPVQIVEAYEDGFAYRRQRKTLTPSDDGSETVWVSRSKPRAIGNHWVIVYDGDRKVAQVEYEVIK